MMATSPGRNDRNQKVIAGNANRIGAMVPGSVRSGDALLVGLLRCGTAAASSGSASCPARRALSLRIPRSPPNGKRHRLQQCAGRPLRAARAHRQYDAVDPDNRLVASDLERRWNEKLGEMARLEEEMRVARKRRRRR
jgi:hypothetical protein